MTNMVVLFWTDWETLTGDVQDLGSQSISTRDIGEVIGLALKGQAAVIIIDLSASGMDGLTLLAQLEEIPEPLNPPVLAFIDRQSSMINYDPWRIDRLLYKPIDVSVIHQTISDLIS